MAANKRGYRRKIPEAFEDITWRPENAEAHFQKHGIPFELAKQLDWSDILKRKDVEHRDSPERFNALVRLPAQTSFGEDFVFFVVYTKVYRLLHVISIRPANAQEREQFRRRSEAP